MKKIQTLLAVAALSSTAVAEVISTLEVDFSGTSSSSPAVMAGAVTGSLKFVGATINDHCSFTGSATGDVTVSLGYLDLPGAGGFAPNKVLYLSGGSLKTTGSFTLPTLSIGITSEIVNDDGHSIVLSTVTGAGAMNFSSPSGQVTFGDMSGNSGGISSCLSPSVINSSTKFSTTAAAECIFGGVASLTAAPGGAAVSNLTFGEIDISYSVGAHDLISSSAAAGQVLKATKINLGGYSWAQNVTAG